MQTLIEEICQNIRNYFVDFYRGDVFRGAFSIENDEIVATDGSKTPIITNGMYYRIKGSYLNDGVYLKGTDIPKDETFKGEIWLMHPPASFLSLVEEIAAWNEINAAVDSANMSPFTSESFGGYSYSKGNGNGQSGSGTAVTWQAQFATRLNAWRKV